MHMLPSAHVHLKTRQKNCANPAMRNPYYQPIYTCKSTVRQPTTAKRANVRRSSLNLN